jgi:putative dehydrogenase
VNSGGRGDRSTAARSVETDTFGIVGLGDMGLGMAGAVARQGLDVFGHDRRAEALRAAERNGVRPVPSLRNLAERARIISLMVVDARDVQEVVLGNDGLLSLMAPGGCIVIQSTVEPATVVHVAEAAEFAGISVLDAPVSGGSVKAAGGGLTIMCGGDRDVLERCRVYLDAMGTVHHLGELGAGQAMKLVNNMIVSAQRAVIREALQLGEAFGIDANSARSILRECTADSWVVRNWDHLDDIYTRHRLASEDPEALIDLLVKDIWLGVTTARERRVFLPIISMIAQSLPDTHRQVIRAAGGRSGESPDNGKPLRQLTNPRS